MTGRKKELVEGKTVIHISTLRAYIGNEVKSLGYKENKWKVGREKAKQ